MATYYRKQGDTRDSLVVTLIRGDGTVQGLTDATSIDFHMAKRDKTIVIDRPATILTPAADGKAQLDWEPNDLAVEGHYLIEWEVVFSDGTKKTFPNDGYDILEVFPQLA